jgi:hypothetical protein
MVVVHKFNVEFLQIKVKSPLSVIIFIINTKRWQVEPTYQHHIFERRYQHHICERRIQKTLNPYLLIPQRSNKSFKMPFRLFQAFKKELLSSANVSTRSFPVPAPCPSVMSFVQIYEGVKSLPLRKLSLDVLIFRHQSTASFFDMKSKEWVESFIPNCIEIVAFDHSSPELEAPHFFLSPKVFYDQLKETNVSDTNGIASRNAHRDLLASDLIIKFVLNRVKVSSEDSTSFEITLSALADDELDFNFIAIKRPGNISSIHDQLKLRKRRFVTNMCDCTLYLI